MTDHESREAKFGPKPPPPRIPVVRATILPDGILTEICQVCRQGGPGLIAVRGVTGRWYTAHRWPCADTVR